MSKLEPLNTYVLLVDIKKEKIRTSGLIVSTKDEKEKNQAKVIAVGKEVKTIKKNDIIIFESYKTTEFKYDGDDYKLIKEEDILARVSVK